MDERDLEHKTHVVKKVIKVIKRPIAGKVPTSSNATSIAPGNEGNETVAKEEVVVTSPLSQKESSNIANMQEPSNKLKQEEISKPALEEEDLEAVVSEAKSIFDEEEAPEEAKETVVSEAKSIFDEEEAPEEVKETVVSDTKSMFDENSIQSSTIPTKARDIHDFTEEISIPEQYKPQDVNRTVTSPVPTTDTENSSLRGSESLADTKRDISKENINNNQLPVDATIPTSVSGSSVPPSIGASIPGHRVAPPPTLGHKLPSMQKPFHKFQEVHTDFQEEITTPVSDNYNYDSQKELNKEKYVSQEDNSGRNFSYSSQEEAKEGGTVTSTSPYDDNFAVRFNLPPKVLSTKYMSFIFGGILLFGIILGIFMGGGDSCSSQPSGLSGVVSNPEVPRGRMRCGIAEKSQGCVLYLMNYQRRDVQAKDFYPLVAQMTGVQRYLIETGNMRYAYTTIKPGYIAQFNVPPVR